MMEDKKAPDQKPTSGADTTLLHQSPPTKNSIQARETALEATFVDTFVDVFLYCFIPGKRRSG